MKISRPLVPRRPFHRGFTLVELLIVVTIVTILASIAIPSYRQHVIKVKRTEAKTELTSIAQRLERCYTRTNTYVIDMAVCPVTLPVLSQPEGEYLITAAPGAITANTFVLTATPQGAQANDTQCTGFTLDQRGTQGVLAGSTHTAAQCW